MESLISKCEERGIIPPEDSSEETLKSLLECSKLAVGIDPSRFGVERMLKTSISNENLKWTSLIVKKSIPEKTFLRVYIGRPELFLTSEGNLNRKTYYAIERTVRDNGEIWIVLQDDCLVWMDPLLKALNEKYSFQRYIQVGDICFNVYGSTPRIPPKLKEPSPRHYELIDLDWDLEYCEKPLHITLEEFQNEMTNQSFIWNFTSSISLLLSYKKNFYLEKRSEIRRQFDLLRRKVSNIKSVGVDSTTVHEMYPMFEFYAGFLFELEEMSRHIQHLQKNLTASKVKENLKDALYNADRGLASLVGRKDIKDQIVSRLYAFSRNWKVFVGNFCNFAILGRSGSGKTKLGQVISFVFARSGILATDRISIVSRSDLVGQYVGQTAPRTRSLLLDSLEGVLFIDEAYQLASGGKRDFGHESITEMVNFLDKYIGMSVVIVAGYEDLMKQKFFPSNEGLERRFPHQIILKSYTISQLTDILVTFLERSIHFPINKYTRNCLYTLVYKTHQKYPAAFDKQAGDMLNLGESLVTAIYSSYKIQWNKENVKDNVFILKDGFQRFLQRKGHLSKNLSI